MTIYVLCPEARYPVGAVKGYYRYVDILNRSGMAAYIVHQERGFRCSWFDNQTPIAYLDCSISRRFKNRVKRRLGRTEGREIRMLGAPTTEIGEGDQLVIPAVMSGNYVDRAPGVPKVIFNRNAYMTFERVPLKGRLEDFPYYHDDVEALLAVSEDNVRYLKYCFEGVAVHRHINSVDTRLFVPSEKRRQICYMPRKLREDVRQVLSILKARNALNGFDLVPIDNLTEVEVARVMGSSTFFLSFSDAEGFGRPPVEAMAAGCVCIGYHGRAGREYFDPAFSYPIDEGDIIGYVRTVTKLLADYDEIRDKLSAQASAARAFVEAHYSHRQEEQAVLSFWKNVMGLTPNTEPAC